MPYLFGFTLFVSAALLFGVQPLLAKMLLPLLGGASAVWTTCMVFYQVVLLAGYGYAHLVTSRLPHGVQAGLQLALLIAAFALLPFAISEHAVDELSTGAEPVAWLLVQLGLVAGLPFFVVSTTGPLLQRWFSQTAHRAAGDPYFLYSASNLGSLLALAAYPLWFEVTYDVPRQSVLWRWGFLALAGLVAVCGFAWFSYSNKTTRTAPQQERSHEEQIPWKRRLRWLLLAFVPSSLMLGVTTYLTTDIASVPMLWVIPLGLYLLTFVFAFSRREWLPLAWMNWLVPVLAIILVFAMLCRATEPVWVLVLAHLGFLFAAGMVCHGRLAADRPSPARLTEFYLWLSVGGAIGGLFNALLAPVIFRDLVEYPLLILIAAALFVPRKGDGPEWFGKAAMRAAVVVPAALTILLGLIAKELGWTPGMTVRALVFGLPTVLCFALVRRPVTFAIALAGVVVGAQVYVASVRRTVFVDRSFFGVSRVTVSASGWFRQLDHGNTAHGRQFILPERVCEPLAYYHRSGPLGTIFAEFEREKASPNVALIGLGAGATLTYSQPGQSWDVYEIDPLVVRIAQTPELFSYATRCSAVKPRIIQGDGRMQFARAEDGRYGLVILDAFSSDAIPMHLLTREAVELYFSKIAEGGWLALHVSNRYLDLEQVIAGLAQEKGFAGLSWIDTEGDPREGKEDSHWVVLARSEKDLRGLASDSRRIPLDSRPSTEPWTDARSSLLPIFRW